MKAHVICCNDSVEFVVLGSEAKANEKLMELADSHYVRNMWSYRDREEYRKLCYWHIHVVPVDLPLDAIGRALAIAIPPGDSRFATDEQVSLALWISEVERTE